MRDKVRQDAVREHFNRQSTSYLASHITPQQGTELRRVFGLLRGNTRYERVLDIGCGPGTVSEELLDIADEVWGIDLSPDMIALARERFENADHKPNLHFRTGDAEHLQFESASFDAVCCLGVFRYLASWKNGLREIYRVLKPNGCFVATFYYRFSPHWFSMLFCYRPLLPLICVLKKRKIGDASLAYRGEPLPFSYKEFRRACYEFGFTQLHTMHSGFELFPFNRILPEASQRLYLWAEPKWHNSSVFGWIGSICVVRAVKRS